MTAKELIAIASRAEDGLTIEEQGILARHVLATVREDDDEPVTVERLEASGWFRDDRYPWLFHHEDASFPVAQPSSGDGFRSSEPNRTLKSMGHLRRLVAALGE